MADHRPEPSDAQPGNKRKRIALACNTCRMRKSRCDGRHPACSSCLGLGYVCQYESTEAAASVLVRKEHLSDMYERIAANERKVQRLDQMLMSHLSNCLPSGISYPTPASGRQQIVLENAGHNQASELEEPRNEDAAVNGMAMNFIEERTVAFFGTSSIMNFAQLLVRAITAVRQSTEATQADQTQRHDLQENSNVTIPMLQPGSSSYAADSTITALPPTEIMDALVDTYFDTAGFVYPCIDEEAMRITYAECKSNRFARVRRTWLGTLNMMFAIASKFDQQGDESISARSRVDRSNLYYHRAMGLCSELSKRVVSLEIVHYLILVVVFCKGSQRSTQAWNSHGLLVNSALALGLHSSLCREKLEPTIAESYRRTWLVICGLDKVLSMVFGRPASISDELMATQQPDLCLLPRFPKVSFNEELRGQFLSASFKLFLVLSKSLAKQYGGNLEKDNFELDGLSSLQASSECRKLLQSWSSSLPDHLAICKPDSPALLDKSQSNRLCVILSLRYYNVAILVHRPPFTTTLHHMFQTDISNSTSQSLLQPMMAEAQECITAAENTIEIVHAVLANDSTSRNNLGAGFFTLFYVFTAALVVSGRLLWSLHGQTPADEGMMLHCKALLKKVQNIFQQLYKYDSLSSSCSRYIQNLSDLYTQVLRDNPSDLQNAEDAYVPTPGFMDTLQLDTQALETLDIMTSDDFDPSLFESFGIFYRT